MHQHLMYYNVNNDLTDDDPTLQNKVTQFSNNYLSIISNKEKYKTKLVFEIWVIICIHMEQK